MQWCILKTVSRPSLALRLVKMASLVEKGDDVKKVVDKTVVRTNEKTGETFTFFFGKDCVFSQWHSAEFRVDGVEYNCAEQYMMHQKAGE